MWSIGFGLIEIETQKMLDIYALSESLHLHWIIGWYLISKMPILGPPLDLQYGQ